MFNEDEIRDFFRSGRYRTIIKVLFLEGLENKVILKKLYENGIIQIGGKGPRINTFISESSFNKLKELGRSNL